LAWVAGHLAAARRVQGASGAGRGRVGVAAASGRLGRCRQGVEALGLARLGRELDARGERKLGEREKREGRESPWRRQQGGATAG
jgi:hypothetical protein